MSRSRSLSAKLDSNPTSTWRPCPTWSFFTTNYRSLSACRSVHWSFLYWARTIVVFWAPNFDIRCLEVKSKVIQESSTRAHTQVFIFLKHRLHFLRVTSFTILTTWLESRFINAINFLISDIAMLWAFIAFFTSYRDIFYIVKVFRSAISARSRSYYHGFRWTLSRIIVFFCQCLFLLTCAIIGDTVTVYQPEPFKNMRQYQTIVSA